MGGRAIARYLISVLTVVPASADASPRPRGSRRAWGMALILDSLLLGSFAGLSALGGFGYEEVISRPGAVVFTFIFAFLLQAVRYMATRRGLDPE